MLKIEHLTKLYGDKKAVLELLAATPQLRPLIAPLLLLSLCFGAGCAPEARSFSGLYKPKASICCRPGQSPA